VASHGPEGRVVIRIATGALCTLLADLALTTAPEDGADPQLASVLLYTDRGYPDPGEPGVSDILVGVSTNRRVAGHVFAGSDGQMTPMLWPVAKVAQVIAVFKPKLKGNKEHGVIITRDTEHVTVQEDPNLFDDGDSITFKLGDIETYPHKLTELIADMPTSRKSRDLSSLLDQPKPRTDFYAVDLALLVKIATGRKSVIETFRLDQDSRILVRIGDYWRGWIRPVPYEQGSTKVGRHAYEPEGDVYHPDLPGTGVDVPDPYAPTEKEPVAATGAAVDPVLPLGADDGGEFFVDPAEVEQAEATS